MKYEEIAVAIAGLEPAPLTVAEYEYQAVRQWLERMGVDPTEQAIATVITAVRQGPLVLSPRVLGKEQMP